MELKQLEQILAIYQEKSITQASKKMYITQSALNQQLLKLEKELGTPLFERRYHEMVPTYAGRIYLSAVQQILNIKRDTYKIINDIAHNDAGEISIAFTPERGSLVFSFVYPLFQKEYPHYHFRTVEARVLRAGDLLLNGDVQLGMMTYSQQNPLDPRLGKLDTGSETMVLAMPASHPLAHLAKGSTEDLPYIELSLLRNEKFILCSHETSFRKMIDFVFQQNDFVPNILFESASTLTILRMVRNQTGLAFIPESYVNKNLPIVYFHVEPLLSWTTCVAFLKGTYISAPEKRFVQLINENYSKMRGIL